jgi:hypothetical protein
VETQLNRARREQRAIRIRSVQPAQLSFPHAQQLARLERTRDLDDPNTKTELVWLVTSLGPERANAARLLELSRAYWGIENGGHGRLDGSAFEDGCRVRHPVAATALGWLRRFVHGQYSAWARSQARDRDRTQPTLFARCRGDPAIAIRFVTTTTARL